MAERVRVALIGAGRIGERHAATLAHAIPEAELAIIADVQARYLLPGGYLRINPKLAKALALDDITRLNDLKNISDITRTDEVLIKKFFLDS